MKKPATVTGPTWLEVDLNALASNVGALRKHVGPDIELMAIVKADGYGAGAIQCSRAALAGGADSLGVSRIAEAIALRQCGLQTTILNLGYCTVDEIPALGEYAITQAVHRTDFARDLAASAQVNEHMIDIHVNVDTGMCRSGISMAEAGEFFEDLKGLSSLTLKGVFTHFPTADAEDTSFAATQVAQFQELRQVVSSIGFDDVLFHAANTAATIEGPQSHFDMVRVGIGIYGLYGSRHVSRKLDLKPVCSLKSLVSHTQQIIAGTGVSYGLTYSAPTDTTIATVQAGYADGIDRRLSNNGHMLVNGHRYPIVGRVTMDQTMLDVGSNTAVTVGDIATIVGRDGDECLLMDDIADSIGTISYELQCGIGPRVPRVYS